MLRRLKAKVVSLVSRAVSKEAIAENTHLSRELLAASRRAHVDILSCIDRIEFQPRYAYLGGTTGLATVDHRHRLFVDTRDRQLTPHLITNGRWEGWNVRLFQQILKEGDVVVDVGSNVGYFVTLAAKLVGDTGHVHAFEANPDIANLLAKTIEINGYSSTVTLRNVAVSDRCGTAQFVTYPDRQGDGGLLEHTSDADLTAGSLVEVKTATLDSVLPQMSDVRLMHLDIEGAEPAALSGARGIIEASPRLVLVVEWGLQKTDLSELRWLISRGFELYVMQHAGPPRTIDLADVNSIGLCDLLLHRGTMFDMGYGAGLHEYSREPRMPPRVTIQPFDGRRIGVAGLFRTRCGLQRGAALMVADLRAKGHVVVAIDLSRVLHHRLTLDPPDLLDPSDTAELGLTDLIIHINPPLFLDARAKFPNAVVEAACIVGYWAWELTVVSDQWRQASRRCDAIWVPSPFVAETLKIGLPDFAGDIRIVPHAVDRDPVPALAADARRALRSRHGFGPADFVVGFTFAFGSNYVRKNPTGAVDAFRRAFDETDGRCHMLLRAHEVASNERFFEHLQRYVGGDDRISVVDVANTPFPIVDFFNCLDVFLSLHRSEGYGLTIAEAAQAGVRSIATGWGLAPDIMRRPEVWTVGSRLVPPLDPQNVYSSYEDALWAEPDIAQAARLLVQARAERVVPD